MFPFPQKQNSCQTESQLAQFSYFGIPLRNKNLHELPPKHQWENLAEEYVWIVKVPLERGYFKAQLSVTLFRKKTFLNYDSYETYDYVRPKVENSVRLLCCIWHLYDNFSSLYACMKLKIFTKKITQ